MARVVIFIPEEYRDYGYKTEGTVGFDICSLEDVEINPGEMKIVSTGVRVKVVEGNVFPAVFPRSSLPVKKSLLLANSVGIIDLDYCGRDDEIKLILYNFGKEKAVIKKGERIAQIVFISFEKPEIEVTRDISAFEKESRGGIGSTGL